MKRLITHDASSHTTGDEVANAVCHYSRVLARVGAVDVVDIPVAVNGRTERAVVTIGWRAGVVAVAAPSEAVETEDIVTVLELYTRAARAMPRGEAFDDDDIDRLQWPDV